MALQREIEELKKNPNQDTKRSIAEKISYYLDSNVFDPKEKQIALEVIELMIKDMDKKVREIISKNLKSYPDLPNHIAVNLAEDNDNDISIPMLEFSSVLNQSDIIKILDSAKESSKICAISKRKDVTEDISAKIIDKNIQSATQSLLQNQAAKISDSSYTKIVENYHNVESIIGCITTRSNLPPIITEKIASIVSDDIKKKLINNYKVPENIVNDVASQTQEEIISSSFKIGAHRENTINLLNRLQHTQKLTPNLVLRALCSGDLLFFALGLGKLASIPDQFAENMVLKEGASSLAALYKKANMPAGTLEAVNVVFKIVNTMLSSNNQEVPVDQDNFSQLLIGKIKEGGYDQKINMMSYIINLIQNKDAS